MSSDIRHLFVHFQYNMQSQGEKTLLGFSKVRTKNFPELFFSFTFLNGDENTSELLFNYV